MAIHVRFRFQDWPDEDLDLVAAYAKSPGAVQDALRDAMCQVALPSSEFRLLTIASDIRAALQQPWNGYKPLRAVLEACRQKKYGHPTERVFHEHSQEEGVVALGLVAKHQNKLIDEIDALSEAESIKLAKLVKRIPKKDVIYEFIDGFLSSKGKEPQTSLVLSLMLLIEDPVRDPPPTFARPRVRSKSKKQRNATPIKDAESSSPQPETQSIDQERKRRKLSLTADNPKPVEVDPELSSSYEGDFSPARQLQTYPLAAHRTPSNGESHARAPDPAVQDLNLSDPKNPDIDIVQRLSPPQMMDEEWNFTMEGRPLEFPQEIQVTDQGGQWNSSMMGDKWDCVESFLEGRPLAFSQEIQVTDQEGQWSSSMMGDNWDCMESFLEGRPLAFPQEIQVMDQRGQ